MGVPKGGGGAIGSGPSNLKKILHENFFCEK